jgi:lysophospholipase L1-like esterase
VGLTVPAAVVVAAAGILAVQVVLATRGPRLEEPVALVGTVWEGAPGGPRMLWLGDSTAAGVGADAPDDALPLQVADVVGGDPTVLVLARSGARVADVLAHQLPLAEHLDPDVVVVSAGANDVTHLTRSGDLRRRYHRLLDGMPAGAEVVVLGVPDMGAIPRVGQPLRAVAGWRGRQLDAVVREVAGAHGARYVDVAGRTGPAFRADPDHLFAADRYHPSGAGYALWARVVGEAVPAGAPG